MYQNTEITKKINRNIILTKYFIILEAVLYFSFLIMDSFNGVIECTNVIKFLAILCCLIFVFISYFRNKDKRTAFMMIVLCFTVMADFTLLFTERFEVGVLFFIIVQLFYSVKIKCMCKDNCKRYMLGVLTVVLIWHVFILALKDKQILSPVVVLASTYFIIFTLNVIKSWINIIFNRNRSTYEISFGIGMLLFYLCDINVGIYNIARMNLEMTNGMIGMGHYAGILIWFFYLPAQVILSINSVLYLEKKQI